jgi:hypothetical protein
MYRGAAGRGRPTALWSAVDHEYEELLEEETAEPKESSKEPAYHAYQALLAISQEPRPLGRSQQHQELRGTQKTPLPEGLSRLPRTF